MSLDAKEQRLNFFPDTNQTKLLSISNILKVQLLKTNVSPLKLKNVLLMLVNQDEHGR
jgi:hypothetical protein